MKEPKSTEQKTTDPETSEPETKALPENAYLPLQPGETYTPIIQAHVRPPELTAYSILWGVFFCVIFTTATAYSTLKVGQGMEAAIPISILAIGLARVFKRRSSLLENVIITGTGGASAAVVAGAVFTLPALYILHLSPNPIQTVFICLAGGCLGVLFVIPLRRFFVREMHGKFPFPEATAITEVLVTGERGGSQARLLLEATCIAGLYDFFVTTFHVWSEYLNLQFIPIMRNLADRGRMAFNFEAIGFILGLGYVMGLPSAIVFCAGGILANFVLVPLIWFLGSHVDMVVYPGTMHVSAMSAAQIYSSYVRYIGVGAIATAGIFGVIKSLRVIAGSFSIALRAFRSRVADTSERTDRDISLPTILLGVIVSALAVAIFFSRLQVSWTILAVGLALTLLFAFFFASVAANAIATTANNPASGMTMLTVIISSVVLLHFGLSGNTGMFFIMAIAGMVCTALCVSGQFMTDLKTGYWLGNTPAAQEKIKFIGILAAAAAAGLTIVLLAHTYQFGEATAGDMRPVLAAPQASIMKALVVAFMSRQPVTYLLFGVGALITIVLEMLGKSSMVFALGIYLPLSLTTPILTGGFLSHFVNRRSEKVGGDAGHGIRERGIILASGLMAGGALGGVLGAALRLFPSFHEDFIQTPFYANDTISQSVSALLFIGLCLYVWFRSMKKEKVQS
ncbi:MAG: oligopeptide transporter, OPT family [Terracidiphilus sp.]|nr:oligopeptide transporter, OPT family [Terracidiphilus sp.]MDR3797361.1 oligopeptide transporter, OPT family [Terracidiphilus sp.]